MAKPSQPIDPSHAFLVTAHAEPQMCRRLTDVLSDAGPVLIHLDAKSDTRGWTGWEHGEFLEDRVKVYWGDWSLCEATVRLVERALLSKEIQRCTIISGTSYPIRSAHEIAERAHGCGNVIATRLAPDPHGGKPVEKFREHAVRSANPDGRAASLTTSIMRRVRRPLTFEEVVGPTGLRAGSAFWSLDRPTAEHVVSRIRAHDDLISYFMKVLLPDETVFQTLAAEVDPIVRQDGTIYVSWASGGKHPDPLDQHQLETAIRETDFWFARKFSTSPADQALVDWIESRESPAPGC